MLVTVSGSGRFGRSVELHNLPLERCSYACIYCGHEPAIHRAVRRRSFFPAPGMVQAVERTLRRCDLLGRPVDHVVVTPDGEPTLDARLGPLLRRLRSLGVPLAVVTNGSLLWRPDVCSDLQSADLVLVRIDAVDGPRWQKTNRPTPQLRLPTILEGITDFVRAFNGEVWTETTLVAGVNDHPNGLLELARFVGNLAPSRAFLSVPATPPAPPHVHAPPAPVLALARSAFLRHGVSVEPTTTWIGTPQEKRRWS